MFEEPFFRLEGQNMLLAMISIAIFAIPIISGIIMFIAGICMLFFEKTRKTAIGVICAGFLIAVVPSTILGIGLIKGELDTKNEYDSLPGKAEVDVNLDRYYFIVDGVGYRQMYGYQGRDLHREKMDITLVDGKYMHFPLERLENDSPYELFYTDMYQATYCLDDEYDQVIAYYDNEADTDVQIRNYLKTERNYQPISVDLAKYNELYHKYHPKMNYNFNESSFDTERIPLEGDIEAYEIETISSDGIYETDTRFLLKEDCAYMVYRKTDTEAVGVLLLPEEEAFFRDIIAKNIK